MASIRSRPDRRFSGIGSESANRKVEELAGARNTMVALYLDYDIKTGRCLGQQRRKLGKKKPG
jgi:hypothetical protein